MTTILGVFSADAFLWSNFLLMTDFPGAGLYGMRQTTRKKLFLVRLYHSMSLVSFFAGQNITDFDKVLRIIQELCYAPSHNNSIDVQYLQNYYSFIQR